MDRVCSSQRESPATGARRGFQNPFGEVRGGTGTVAELCARERADRGHLKALPDEILTRLLNLGLGKESVPRLCAKQRPPKAGPAALDDNPLCWLFAYGAAKHDHINLSLV